MTNVFIDNYFDIIDSYAWNCCEDFSLFWFIFSNSFDWKTEIELGKQFLNKVNEYKSNHSVYNQEEFEEVIKDTYVFELVDAINNNEFISYEGQLFFEEQICPTYDNVLDFARENEGKTIKQIIKEFIKNDSDYFYDEQLDEVIQYVR